MILAGIAWRWRLSDLHSSLLTMDFNVGFSWAGDFRFRLDISPEKVIAINAGRWYGRSFHEGSSDV